MFIKYKTLVLPYTNTMYCENCKTAAFQGGGGAKTAENGHFWPKFTFLSKFKPFIVRILYILYI